jgi:hypothetical protein
VLVNLLVFLEEFKFNALLLSRLLSVSGLVLIRGVTVSLVKSHDVGFELLVIMDVQL